MSQTQNKLNKVNAEWSKRINFQDILTVLTEEKIVQSTYEELALNIPAGLTINAASPVTPGTASIPVQSRFYVDTDHVFSFSVSLDNATYPLYSDTDTVQNRYNYPFNFYELGIFVAFKNTTVNITNNGTSSAYFSGITFGASMSVNNWNKVVQNYFKPLVSNIGINVNPI